MNELPVRHKGRSKARSVRLSAHSKRVTWSCTDGRTTIGRVILRGGLFIAFDSNGHEIAGFATLYEAQQALLTLKQPTD
jgi:hypothetical protein